MALMALMATALKGILHLMRLPSLPTLSLSSVALVTALTALVALSPVATTSTHAQTYTSSGGPFNIPDPNTAGPAAGLAGVSSTINVSDTFTVGSFNSITIFGLEHRYLGDLIATLTHGSVSVDIFDRVQGSGVSSGSTTASDSSDLSGNYTFALNGADFRGAANAVDGSTAVPSNVTYAPYLGGDVTQGNPGGSSPFTQTFNDFALTSVQGPWTLNISDRVQVDSGSFTGWSFNVTPQAAPPSTAAPEPGSLALLLPVMGAAGIVIRKRRRH